MKLPEPRRDGTFSVEIAIAGRRSVRGFADEALSLEEVSQLLWAAQGITGESGTRAAPSAGATYPLRVYLAAGNVDGLEAGTYRYEGITHELVLLDRGNGRAKLGQAAAGQEFVREAPAGLIITGVSERTTRRYRELGERYVNMEAGHAAQNVYLQATAMGLGTVAVGAFDGAAVIRMLWLLPGEKPLYIMPVGKPARGEQD